MSHICRRVKVKSGEEGVLHVPVWRNGSKEIMKAEPLQCDGDLALGCN